MSYIYVDIYIYGYIFTQMYVKRQLQTPNNSFFDLMEDISSHATENVIKSP